MPKVSFDAERFYSVLDSHRISRRLTWKQVAQQSGVNASTLTRMAQKKRPDVDSLTSLLKWSGETSDSFMVATHPDGDHFEAQNTLANVTAQFRADKNLSEAGKKAIETTIKVLYEQFMEPTKK
jgi:transcriptional regulator with XRE-family HTH domain